MTGLLEAIPFLKGAVGRSSGNPTYGFHDGVIYARSSDTGILASYPIPHILGTFALSANELEAAVGRMKGEPEISSGDGTIILRSGGRKSTLDLLDYEAPGGMIPEDTAWDDLPDKLLDAIRLALPFVATEGNWQRSVLLDAGRVAALSGRSVIEIKVPGLEAECAAFPTNCADYLCDIKEAPTGWIVTDVAVGFGWDCGARVKCQTLAISWPKPYNSPDFLDDFENKVGNSTPVTVDDDYRSAFADVAVISNLSDGTVTIKADRILGKADHATQEVEFETGSATETRWNIKSLVSVVAVAQEWFPDSDGPSFFRGENLRGIITKRR